MLISLQSCSFYCCGSHNVKKMWKRSSNTLKGVVKIIPMSLRSLHTNETFICIQTRAFSKRKLFSNKEYTDDFDVLSYLIVKGNAILEAVGVPADKERLEWVDGLLLKMPSEGVSNKDIVELMLGLRLNIDPDLMFLALWYLMAAIAQTSNASTLSFSGFLALVST